MEAAPQKRLMKHSGIFTDADCLLMAFIMVCIGIISTRRSTSSASSQRQNASIVLAGCNLSDQLHQPLHAYKDR